MRLHLGHLGQGAESGAAVGAGVGAAPRVPITVREVQQALTQSGHNPGPIDGIWGNLTKDALIAWGAHSTDYTVSADMHSVSIRQDLANSLRTLAARYQARRASAAEPPGSAVVPAPARVPTPAHTGSSIMDWFRGENAIWYGLGALAVVAIGAGLIFGRKKRRRRR